MFWEEPVPLVKSTIKKILGQEFYLPSDIDRKFFYFQAFTTNKADLLEAFRTYGEVEESQEITYGFI